MARVRFHDICDFCGAHSDEYSPWHMCRECNDHVCPLCELTAEGDDETNSTLCTQCADMTEDERRIYHELQEHERLESMQAEQMVAREEARAWEAR